MDKKITPIKVFILLLYCFCKPDNFIARLWGSSKMITRRVLSLLWLVGMETGREGLQRASDTIKRKRGNSCPAPSDQQLVTEHRRSDEAFCYLPFMCACLVLWSVRGQRSQVCQAFLNQPGFPCRQQGPVFNTIKTENGAFFTCASCTLRTSEADQRNFF